MSEGYILFTKGKQYQLTENFTVRLHKCSIPDNIVLGPIKLFMDGYLTIDSYYTWDGPSGPTKFFRGLPLVGWMYPIASFMRGALVHDALYQLMRHNLLSAGHRDWADGELIWLCKVDGMTAYRRWWVYRGLEYGGGASIRPENIQKVYRAPN